MLAILRQFVETESPSLEKAAADRCCGLIASSWGKYDVRVERLAQKHRGDHLRISYWPGKTRPAGQLLVLGHYDSVYSSGTLRKMPFRISRGEAYGPGIFDMKAGIVQALFALHALQETNAELRKRIVFLWTSDEEIGSESSRKLLEAEARRSDAVFVLEPSFGPRGLLKTARKGVGTAELTVHGRASHAGLAPQEGINALDVAATPHGAAEKTGHFMEQTGEYLLPGPGEEKLGLKALQNFPKIAAVSKLAIPAMRTGYPSLPNRSSLGGPTRTKTTISDTSSGGTVQATMPQQSRQVFPLVRFHACLNVKSRSPAAHAGSNRLRRAMTANAAR